MTRGFIAIILLFGFNVVGLAQDSSIRVTNTGDSGLGSLRQAIIDANARPGLDTITFDLSGPAPHVIAPTTALPEITDSAILDASSQPGYGGSPVVEIRGAAGIETGLWARAGGTTIRGLAIGGFTYGVRLGGDSSPLASDVVLEGCHIGVDASGTNPIPNSSAGVYVTAAYAARIGGPSPAQRNVISANRRGITIDLNANATAILGNYIGTDVNGSLLLGNTDEGIYGTNRSGPMTIGGTEPGAGNVIAHNDAPGISVYRVSGVVVLSNSMFGNDPTSSQAHRGLHYQVGYGVPPVDITYVVAEGSGTRVDGGIRARTYPGMAARVEIFRSPSCDTGGNAQGKTLVGVAELLLDDTGFAPFSVFTPGRLSSQEVFTATATAYGPDGVPHTTGPFAECRTESAGCRHPLIVDGLPDVISVPTGQPVTLPIGATGTDPLTYDWEYDGATISGSRTVTITPTRTASVRVTVTNACGEDWMLSSLRTCNSAPTLATMPNDSTVVAGVTSWMTFRSDEAVQTALYQGDRGDTSRLIATGKDNAQFLLPALEQTTKFWVRVTNGCGQADSDSFTVTVVPKPTITSVRVRKGPSGKQELQITGANFLPGSEVTVDGSPFAKAASVTSGRIVQRGKLVNGTKLTAAFPVGVAVTVRVAAQNVVGSSVSKGYTR